MVRDAHLAEDVTQGVFVALAQNARQLTNRAVLSGWLHRTAQNLAANAVRSEVRRRAREQEAAAMNELLAPETDPRWEEIAPQLDTALSELSEPDRDAVLLRYFERKSAREMAQALGTSEEAAQRRVSRAVERLREFFTRRGVAVGASGLAALDLRPRRPGCARRAGGHHFRRRSPCRGHPRRHCHCNRRQSHRHDHTAKDHHRSHAGRRRRHGHLRSPPGLAPARPGPNAPAAASAAGRASAATDPRAGRQLEQAKPGRCGPGGQELRLGVGRVARLQAVHRQPAGGRLPGGNHPRHHPGRRAQALRG